MNVCFPRSGRATDETGRNIFDGQPTIKANPRGYQDELSVPTGDGGCLVNK